jgi:hypothetical protein
MSTKTAVLWVVVLYRMAQVYQCFRGLYGLLQGIALMVDL